MKRSIIFGIVLILLRNVSMAQVKFTDRVEFEVKYAENDFMTMFTPNGLIAFRANKEKGLNSQIFLELVGINDELIPTEISKTPVKSGYELIGYDWHEGYFYALFQKGNSNLSDDRYILKIDINSPTNTEISIKNVLDMSLKEFFAMENKLVFMGDSESLPVIQFYDLETSNVITAPGIYSKDSKILQLRRDEELGVIDVLMSKRDQFKTKQVFILTFDTDGNKIREITIDNLNDPKIEIIEGILTPMNAYNQSLIGTYGKKRQEAYQGIYLSEINEFGELSSRYFTLENLENFYNFLPDKAKAKRKKALEKNLKKGIIPPIRPVLSTREVITSSQGYLIYSDLFSANHPRYMPRDGMYANSLYRYNPNNPYYNNMFIDPYMGYRGLPGGANFNTLREGEYKFQAAHLFFVSFDGDIIWENSIELPNKMTSNPSKFGEISYSNDALHYMYLDGKQLSLTYLVNGEKLFENVLFDLDLVNENERIRETNENSLMLQWWHDNFYLLSGKQSIRFQDTQGKQNVREVFFITKIAVNGDLYETEKKD
ncbi:transcriptional regulator [Belliella kenyensis]|uniref:Transcriptional regulator n=1 Tax=Belliella kenyensis TaxID=1472724 RepID=A0ABV8EIU4_9BACT|nr:transcriptional regulator [Belliella kenyensis]MCH7401132.1 transcriptional regulator [Belliella kenyensis]MDN3604129.1 transcriptional regulator [Belliella kenyensis]